MLRVTRNTFMVAITYVREFFSSAGKDAYEKSQVNFNLHVTEATDERITLQMKVPTAALDLILWTATLSF